MTITSSGLVCDVCGNYIMPWDGDYMVLKVTGIEAELHCDPRCTERLTAAGNDWTQLPAGPLRTVFEKHEKAQLPRSAKATETGGESGQASEVTG
jgi:hypothetical protein